MKGAIKMPIQNPLFFHQFPNFAQILRRAPSASAWIKGSSEFPMISGNVSFFQTAIGVLVSVQITGLPSSERTCRNQFFAFHIHSGGICNPDDAFADTQSHYNPDHCDHPDHAGDLLPILGNHGYAFEVFLTDNFSVDEIVGKTVIVHRNPDDFTSQPSGNAGTKIACGEIVRTLRRT